MLEKIKKGTSMKPAKIMLIGVEGVGKSTAGASMPNPIFICGENGLVGPQFAETSHYEPEGWADMVKFIDSLAREEHDFKTVVIDTLDWIEPELYKFVCERDHKKNIEDYGYGRGYVVALNEARTFVAKLDVLNAKGMYVMILSHCKIKTFCDPEGDNYDRYEPKVNTQLSGLFKEWCDDVLFAKFDQYTEKNGLKAKAFGGKARIVNTTHGAACDAKNRHGLPDVMPLDMKEILAAINAGQPADTKPILDEIKSLLPKASEKLAKSVKEYIEKNPKADATTLAKALNKLSCEAAMNNNEKEADNA